MSEMRCRACEAERHDYCVDFACWCATCKPALTWPETIIEAAFGLVVLAVVVWALLLLPGQIMDHDNARRAAVERAR